MNAHLTTRPTTVALAVTLLATALLASSCGDHPSESKSSTGSAVTVRTDAATAASLDRSSPPASAAEARNAAYGSALLDTTESLPPDLVVSVPDTSVTPGEPVEFTVQATSDVGEVVLWDGLNDPQALVHDAEHDVWRVTYRVPLKPSRERWGVSLTARTPAQRWRRVWVFLTVANERSLVPVETSSKDS